MQIIEPTIDIRDITDLKEQQIGSCSLAKYAPTKNGDIILHVRSSQNAYGNCNISLITHEWNNAKTIEIKIIRHPNILGFLQSIPLPNKIKKIYKTNIYHKGPSNGINVYPKSNLFTVGTPFCNVYNKIYKVFHARNGIINVRKRV